jgi:hypothetical protein
VEVFKPDASENISPCTKKKRLAAVGASPDDLLGFRSRSHKKRSKTTKKPNQEASFNDDFKKS